MTKIVEPCLTRDLELIRNSEHIYTPRTKTQSMGQTEACLNTKFPMRVKIEQMSQDGKDSYWRTLCIVYDNESLGLLERLLPLPIRTESV